MVSHNHPVYGMSIQLGPDHYLSCRHISDPLLWDITEHTATGSAVLARRMFRSAAESWLVTLVDIRTLPEVAA